jgi:hypothetical protein
VRRPSAASLKLRLDKTSPLPPRRDGDDPIRLPIAGVAHLNRRRAVQRLVLGEIVRLRRDPLNDFDPNAIAVETSAGELLGYVGRNAAARLFRYMDTRPEALEAVVTELTSDISAEVVGAAISFYVPRELAAGITSQAEGWDFCCDSTAGGGLYLMLNCDEAELTRVTEALRRHGFEWTRSGLAHGIASDGRRYRWYVRLEVAPPSQVLAKLLGDTLGASRRVIGANEWIAEFEPENVRLRIENDTLSKENSALREENTQLNARIEELAHTPSAKQERRAARGRPVDGVIATLLPRIRLLRDSLDVVERELESPLPVLRELRQLCWEPSAVRGERVENALEWREKHFATGQKSDGRIYFRHADGAYHVLVSFKDCQERDIGYLRRQ